MSIHKFIPLLLVFITVSIQVKSNTIDSLQHVLQSQPDDSIKVLTLLALSGEMMNGDIDQMFYYGQKAKQLSEKINYPKGIVKGMNCMAVSLQTKGKTNASLKIFEAAAKVAKDLGSWELESMIMNNIGVNFYLRGDYTQAYVHHHNAYEIDKAQKDTVGIAITLGSMGEDLAADNQHLRAIELLVESKELSEYLNDTYLINWNTILIANSYLELKDYSKVDELIQKGIGGLSKNESANDHYIRSLYYNLNAKFLNLQGKKEMALEMAQRSEEIARASGFYDVLRKNLTISASIYYKQEKYSQAITTSKEALKLSLESRALADQKENYNLLTNAYAAMEDFESAYMAKSNFQSVSDSLTKLTLERNIRDLDYQHQLAQVDAENQLLKVNEAKSQAMLRQRTYGGIAILSLFGLMTLVAFTLYRGKRRRVKNSKVLEERVKSRTIELEEVNEQLKVSNQELERFAYITSHDLKEPLRNINGFVKLLQREKPHSTRSKAEEEYFEFILRNVSQMQQLINDVLSFSKISSQNLKVSPVNVSDLVEETKIGLSELIKEKKGVVEISTIPLIFTNNAQLRILLKNLIENGIKYNDKPIPTVSINYQLVDNFHHLIISDNGIGIEDRYHNQIFGMFKRLHNRKEYKGSGLGLAICKKIINRLGGDILLDSELGIGSTFTVILPVMAELSQTCLLYTSPSPRDLSTSRMPSSA